MILENVHCLCRTHVSMHLVNFRLVFRKATLVLSRETKCARHLSLLFCREDVIEGACLRCTTRC